MKIKRKLMWYLILPDGYIFQGNNVIKGECLNVMLPHKYYRTRAKGIRKLLHCPRDTRLVCHVRINNYRVKTKTTRRI